MKISVVTPTIRPEGLEVMKKCLEAQTEQDFEWLVEVGLTNKGHDLNAAFNRMLRRAQGELIVFYEDYTKIMPDGLERFWKAYRERPGSLFTAPLGKVNKWGESPVWDWRAHKQRPDQTDYTDSSWNTCELDWGAIPKKVLYDIGGFDEELDNWWSMDNVSVGKRADQAGYKFACLFTNPAVAFDHDAHIKHPFRDRYNSKEANARMATYEPGVPLPYLVV